MSDTAEPDAGAAPSVPSGRRGREARRTARAQRGALSIPYITRSIPLTEVLGEEGLAIIEHNADTILEEIGIEFRDDEEALQLWREAGADVKGTRVHFPRGLPRSLIQKTAPREYVSMPATPSATSRSAATPRSSRPVYGPPFVRDLDEGRRYGTIEDFRNFVKLAYMSPAIHHSGGTVCEPVDLPVNKRHLEMVYAHMRSPTSRSWAR